MIEPGDLAAMRAIASARWRADAPFVEQHVGDIAWGANPSLGGELVRAIVGDGAYAFRDDDEWHLGAVRGVPYDALVAAAADAGATVFALERETDKVAALRAAGFVRDDTAWYWHLARDLADLPPLPGVEVVEGASDPDARVALHRAAWQGSAFSREVYDAVRATPPYREDLDVVVTSGGEWAAYVLAWLDEGSASGELEPVGTAAAFRRRGLAAAACVTALHRLRGNGARTAVVYAVSDPANTGPRALYESVGFRVVDRHVRYRPPTRQNAGTA